VLYVAMNWDYFRLHPLLILRIDQGGLVFYGGFLAAALGLVFFARRRHEPVLPLFDFVATALPLGHAFGRIGCFLNGCCYGRPWSGALAVRFPADSPPWQHQMEAGRILRAATDSLPVHPVQLYEAAFNLALYALLAWQYRRRGQRVGSTTALYLLAYSLGRYAMETFRGDDRLHWWGLSVSQHVSIGVFLMGVLALAWTHRTTTPDTARRAPPTPANGSTAG
jgi:phosphatidylglycerol:prolipoprotein diacylglycerol transferase